MAFLADVGVGELRRVSIHDEDYVLFRTEDSVQALLDRCPHRSARLSDGHLRDGRLECAYHGWQFDRNGRCVHVPQLASRQDLPAAHASVAPTAVRQGMIWVWGGREDESDPEGIPTLESLEGGGFDGVDFSMDLPYGQDDFIENVVDYSHIHVVHDGVRGGGHRRLAGPLEFDVSEVTAHGFSATFGAEGAQGMHVGGALAEARVEFRAPNLVHYESVYKDAGRRSGLALYSLPLGRGRCRLLYRTYSNFSPWMDRIRPRFLEHGHQCHLLEQDLAVIMGQAETLRRTSRTPADLWTPLKGSDALVLRFREWLDAFMPERPDHVGLRSRGPRAGDPWPVGSLDRYSMHTIQCGACSKALRRLQRARRWLAPTAFLALAVAVLVGPETPARAAFVLLAVLVQAAAMLAGHLARRLTDPGSALTRTSSPLATPRNPAP